MKKKKMFRYSVLLFTSLLVLSACGSKDPATRSGNVLRIARDTDIKTLDGSLATDGMSFEILKTFTEGLVDYDKDGVVISRLAKSWDISADGLTYTFKLRDDAKWSNGDPVTAHDFVYSWQRTVDPQTKADYAMIIADAGIKNAAEITAGNVPVSELGVKAVDDHTLELSLSATVPYLMELLTFPTFHPMNEKFVTEKGANYAKSKDDLVSNGPFVLTEWTPGNSWKLTKNKDYYGAEATKIDGIEYKVLSDYQTAALEFDKGNIDMTKISSELVSRYNANDAYTKQPLGYLWFIAPNNDNPDLKNKDLRLALGYGIDRKHIVDDIMGDGSIAAEFVVPVGLSTGPDGKDFRDSSDKYLQYDKDKAQKHLNDAKTALNKTDFKFELLIEDSQESKTNAEAIQADLNELDGLTIEITTVPKKDRLDRMKASNYELGLTRWGPDYADPFTYMGTLFVTGTAYNYQNYSNAEYDAMVAKTAPGGELSTDSVARWQTFKDAEKLLLSEAGVVPIWQSSDALLVNPKVKGIEMHVVGLPSFRNVVIAD